MQNLSRHNLDFPTKICIQCTTVSLPSAHTSQSTQLMEHGNMLQYTYATPQTPSTVIYLFWQQTKHSPHLTNFCHLILLCCNCMSNAQILLQPQYTPHKEQAWQPWLLLTYSLVVVVHDRCDRSSSSSSSFLTSQQFSWFSKEYRSHWPSIPYSPFCHKLSAYTAWIKYYCFLNLGIHTRVKVK